MQKELPRSRFSTALRHRGAGPLSATRGRVKGEQRAWSAGSVAALQAPLSSRGLGAPRAAGCTKEDVCHARLCFREAAEYMPRAAGVGHAGARTGEGEVSPMRALPAPVPGREGRTRASPFPGAWRAVRNLRKTAPTSFPGRVCRPSRFKRSPRAGRPPPFPGLRADKGFLLPTRPRGCVPSARNAEPP